jgi:hypothetical protein
MLARLRMLILRGNELGKKRGVSISGHPLCVFSHGESATSARLSGAGSAQSG